MLDIKHADSVEFRSARLAQGRFLLSIHPTGALSGERFLNCRYLPAPLEPRHKNANSACDASRLSITRPAEQGRLGGVASAARCRRRSPGTVDPPAEAAAAAAASSVQGGRPGAAAAGGRPNLPSALSRPGGVGGRGGGGVRGSEGSRCGAAARGGGRGGPAVAGLSSGGGGGFLLTSDREPAAR